MDIKKGNFSMEELEEVLKRFLTTKRVDLITFQEKSRKQETITKNF